MVTRRVRTGAEGLHEKTVKVWKGRLYGKPWMINYEVFTIWEGIFEVLLLLVHLYVCL